MENLRSALRGLLGPNVGISVTDPAAVHDLWPAERAAIASAVPKRQIEFAAGRHAARKALAELGVAPVAIPQGTDRAPVWPTDIAGSISHCTDCCIAVVARRAVFPTLGVDVEPATALDADLVPLICTPAEQVWVAAQRDPGHAAKRIFCAKEAIYKAQYPLTGRVIGFEDVTVTIDGDIFTATSTLPLPTLKGAILIQDDLILAVAHV